MQRNLKSKNYHFANYNTNVYRLFIDLDFDDCGNLMYVGVIDFLATMGQSHNTLWPHTSYIGPLLANFLQTDNNLDKEDWKMGTRRKFAEKDAKG